MTMQSIECLYVVSNHRYFIIQPWHTKTIVTYIYTQYLN